TETVKRVISIFPPHQEDQIRAQLAAVIQGIVCQRLVVRADGRGRVPAVEVMVATGLIRDSIRDSAKTLEIPLLIAAGHAQYGMQTFDQSLLQLYREELITYETARGAASNPPDLDLKVKGILSPGGTTSAQTPPARAPRPGGSRPARPSQRGGRGPRAACPRPGPLGRGRAGPRRRSTKRAPSWPPSTCLLAAPLAHAS